MRFRLIACKVMLRELYELCARSPHIVEIYWMPQALHATPSLLRKALQRAIDEAENDPDIHYDAILLGFGLCSMATAGLCARKLPLVIPRAHDCITMLLGERARYQSWFERFSGGIYWYSPGWIELFDTPGKRNFDEAVYQSYVEKYGEDNAQYLMEEERSWLDHYEAAVFIQWPGMETAALEQTTRDIAQKMNLQYLCAPGTDSLLRKLVYGDWDRDILVLKPGQSIFASYDEEVMTAK